MFNILIFVLFFLISVCKAKCTIVLELRLHRCRLIPAGFLSDYVLIPSACIPLMFEALSSSSLNLQFSYFSCLYFPVHVNVQHCEDSASCMCTAKKV